MVLVMPRPPQRAWPAVQPSTAITNWVTALRCKTDARSIAIDSRDEEHAQDVKRHGDTERRRTDAGEDYCKARGGLR